MLEVESSNVFRLLQALAFMISGTIPNDYGVFVVGHRGRELLQKDIDHVRI